MPIYDLNATAASINVAEDVRGALTPVNVNVTNTSTIVLAANSARATAAIYNAGATTAFLREGTSPATTTVYNYPLPPGRLWEPDPNIRYLGAISAVTATGSTDLKVSESLIVI